MIAVWLVIGFISGATIPAGIGLLGARWIFRNPEFLMKYIGKKLVHSVREDLQKQ